MIPQIGRNSRASSAFIRENVRLRLLTSRHFFEQSLPPLHAFLLEDSCASFPNSHDCDSHGVRDLHVILTGQKSVADLVVEGVAAAELDVEFGGEGFDAGVGREAMFFIEDAGVAEHFEAGDAEALGDLAAGEAVE
jgi:hypothetical protein